MRQSRLLGIETFEILIRIWVSERIRCATIWRYRLTLESAVASRALGPSGTLCADETRMGRGVCLRFAPLRFSLTRVLLQFRAHIDQSGRWAECVKNGREVPVSDVPVGHLAVRLTQSRTPTHKVASATTASLD